MNTASMNRDITTSESTALVKNLLRDTLSSIAYVRNIFPKDVRTNSLTSYTLPEWCNRVTDWNAGMQCLFIRVLLTLLTLLINISMEIQTDPLSKSPQYERVDLL